MSGPQKITERDVIKVLDAHHLPHSCRGFPFLLRAIMIVVNDREMRESRRVMPLYGLVGNEYGTTDKHVERAIRTMLGKAVRHMTTGQFIFWVADNLVYNENNEDEQEAPPHASGPESCGTETSSPPYDILHSSAEEESEWQDDDSIEESELSQVGYAS